MLNLDNQLCLFTFGQFFFFVFKPLPDLHPLQGDMKFGTQISLLLNFNFNMEEIQKKTGLQPVSKPVEKINYEI